MGDSGNHSFGTRVASQNSFCGAVTDCQLNYNIGLTDRNQKNFPKKTSLSKKWFLQAIDKNKKIWNSRSSGDSHGHVHLPARVPGCAGSIFYAVHMKLNNCPEGKRQLQLHNLRLSLVLIMAF